MPFTDLDVQTVMILLFFGNLTAVVVLVSYKILPENNHQYYQFIGGKLLQSLAWLLFAIWETIPYYLSVQIANSILFAGFALETLAITNSTRQIHHSKKIFTILAAVSIILFLVFSYAPSNIRIIICSCNIVAIFITCSFFLLTHPSGSRLRKAIGVMYIFLCAILIFRGVYAYFSESSDFTILTGNFTQSLSGFILFFIMLVSGIGFLLLLKEHEDTVLLESNIEQKKLIRALRTSELFNRGLVENLPNYIIVYGQDRQILYVNPSVSDVLGYNPEEIIGKSILTIIPEELRKKISETITSRLNGNEMAMYETDLITKDKKRITVIVRGTSIEYQKGIAILLVLTDITERKSFERALKENEIKFVSIFKETPDPIIIINSQNRIINVNMGFEKVFGQSHREIIGKKIEETALSLLSTLIIPPDQGDNLDIHVVRKEITFKNNVGSPFIAEVALSHITIQNEPCILIQIHDIDQIRRAHEAIAQVNHKLKILNSITRHDILNLVMIAYSYSDILEDEIADTQMALKLNAIKNATREIQYLIEFTGYYQNLGNSAPSWQSIEEILQKHSIQELLSGITLISEIMGLRIFADKMLEKVIYNLIDNSIRHGTNISFIRFTSYKKGDSLFVCYEDNGGGIQRDDKEKIFNKGFGKNTGLGLFLIREILSITGILIHETGEYGTGVRFEMQVPNGKFKWEESEKNMKGNNYPENNLL